MSLVKIRDPVKKGVKRRSKKSMLIVMLRSVIERVFVKKLVCVFVNF